ncbi:hypothetical protein [Rubrivirga sp. IMCC45206]|uniref:hypothetical protein n=1 Tax=Rubrivirga sp. IMCC45206 TaxID=3391614 RepID=UPI00398FA350
MTPAIDPWVDAAAAVRHAVLLTDGVSGVSESAAFQTCGVGGAVDGVALAPAPGGARLAVGVVVGPETAPDHVGGVARLVRSAVLAAWARARMTGPSGDPLPLHVAVHIVDLASAPALMDPSSGDHPALMSAAARSASLGGERVHPRAHPPLS